MIFNVEPVKQSLTSPAVTIEVDAETCFLLSQVLKDLGEALGRAERRYNARKRFEALIPSVQAAKAVQRAAIAARAIKLKDLPPRKITSAIAKEFEIGWDISTFILSDIRREERQNAALDRERIIDGMLAEGKKLKEIADALGLSEHYLRNIVCRRKKTAGQKGYPAARASGRSDAV